MNRQQFISELLDSKNVIPAGKGRRHCIICTEKYGTPTTQTGEPERQIRLPCKKEHTVGCDCIARWLKDHNSCPVCRQEFFPTETAGELIRGWLRDLFSWSTLGGLLGRIVAYMAIEMLVDEALGRGIRKVKPELEDDLAD